MIRVVLAVVLAAALVGASLPAVEDARATRAARTAERGAAALRDAATGLVRESDPVPHGIAVVGAHASVRVRVPAPALADAGLTYLAVGGHPDRSLRIDGPASDAVVYRVGDRPPRIVPFPVDLRAIRAGRLRGDAVPLVLRGDARLRLGYVRVDGGSAVTVARRSVRKFKSGNGTSRVRADAR